MKRIAATLILMVLVAGCTSVQMADDSKATEEGVQSVVDANNQFALELYSRIKGDDGNIFFSPYSVSTAFSIAYEGARGETAEEMQSVFHFPEDEIVRRSSFARLHNNLNKWNKQYELHTANALWAHKNYNFLEEYITSIEKYYAGKTTNVDFVEENEKTRVMINGWVEEQTRNKIKDLLPSGSINDVTRLVITNAIYFKGFWSTQFKKSLTQDEDFTLMSGETVKVPMMRMFEDEVEFNYMENDDLQALELPYRGKDLSMLILLPKDDITSLEESITFEYISQLKNDLQEQEVRIYLPKFKFETKYFLSKTLEEMGMPLAFSLDADFSGMDGISMLYITKAIHQAFVEVNEEGTEAAAATGIVMTLKGVPIQKEFRADHPFIFLIQEKSTGNILFLGRVADPR